MALEGLERVVQVGDILSRKNNGVNPYAAELAHAKLDTLLNHKSVAIQKRATKILKEHFEACVICKAYYSRHDPDMMFCAECRGFVCVDCDCVVYHLSYQVDLWSEESKREQEQTSQMKMSKKQKKLKQKQKAREKKAALALAKKPTATTTNAKKTRSQQQQAQRGSGESESSDEDSDEDEGEGDTVSAKSLVPGSTFTSGTQSEDKRENTSGNTCAVDRESDAMASRADGCRGEYSTLRQLTSGGGEENNSASTQDSGLSSSGRAVGSLPRRTRDRDGSAKSSSYSGDASAGASVQPALVRKGQRRGGLSSQTNSTEESNGQDKAIATSPSKVSSTTSESTSLNKSKSNPVSGRAVGDTAVVAESSSTNRVGNANDSRRSSSPPSPAAGKKDRKSSQGKSNSAVPEPPPTAIGKSPGALVIPGSGSIASDGPTTKSIAAAMSQANNSARVKDRVPVPVPVPVPVLVGMENNNATAKAPTLLNDSSASVAKKPPLSGRGNTPTGIAGIAGNGKSSEKLVSDGKPQRQTTPTSKEPNASSGKPTTKLSSNSGLAPSSQSTASPTPRRPTSSSVVQSPVHPSKAQSNGSSAAVSVSKSDKQQSSTSSAKTLQSSPQQQLGSNTLSKGVKGKASGGNIQSVNSGGSAESAKSTAHCKPSSQPSVTDKTLPSALSLSPVSMTQSISPPSCIDENSAGLSGKPSGASSVQSSGLKSGSGSSLLSLPGATAVASPGNLSGVGAEGIVNGRSASQSSLAGSSDRRHKERESAAVSGTIGSTAAGEMTASGVIHGSGMAGLAPAATNRLANAFLASGNKGNSGNHNKPGSSYQPSNVRVSMKPVVAESTESVDASERSSSSSSHPTERKENGPSATAASAYHFDTMSSQHFPEREEEDDDLVDYLQETGSILALAQKLGL